MKRYYPAKLILFGEYSLILGSQVIGIPLSSTRSYWGTEAGENSKLTSRFFKYLKSNCREFLSIDKISEIQKGDVYYRSNIKRGYGTGSSGALSAAIIDYCGRQDNSGDLIELQSQLALVESFFHGKSSGFDPLLSYMNQAICINRKKKYEFLDPLLFDDLANRLYLLDSGTKRITDGLVPLFIEKAKNDPKSYQKLVEINNDIIENLIHKKDIKPFFKKLSQFQWDHMQEMILDNMKEIWLEGLKSDKYYMKICGSGGGGYYMCYMDTNETHIGPHQLEPIVLS